MMLDGRIAVPRLQLASIDGKVAITAGIERVVRPFLESKAGTWSALQFMVDHDPNLGKPPIDALRAGNVAGVEHAARAYLGLDEGQCDWPEAPGRPRHCSHAGYSRRSFPRTG
jgi:hypothetical protein